MFVPFRSPLRVSAQFLKTRLEVRTRNKIGLAFFAILMYGSEDEYSTDAPQVSAEIDVGAVFAAEDGTGTGEMVAAAEQSLPVQPPSNQLTLSFQGEVYVFDSVRPERVQAVLLLLGGQELPSDFPGMTLPYNMNNRSSNDFPRSSNAHRLASIMRYREKRKNLCFDKKVVYTVRKEVASRMKRHKGQFASSKTNTEEVVSPSSSCELAQSNSQEETVQQSFCQHCGTAKGSTPMMRRGPSGPRSLCNACGLMWANKGTLRNLQSSTSGIQNSSINPNEQSDANDSDIGSNGHMFSTTSKGPGSIVIDGIDATVDFADR